MSLGCVCWHSLQAQLDYLGWRCLRVPLVMLSSALALPKQPLHLCRVSSDSKLGRQRGRTIVPLSAVRPDGGVIPRTLVVVHRWGSRIWSSVLLGNAGHSQGPC